ncbi:hypothetical protein KM043_003058 [Ampulex compressa]|nr:hypothetical protein KM043_003058 [Ampulex compressa]
MRVSLARKDEEWTIGPSEFRRYPMAERGHQRGRRKRKDEWREYRHGYASVLHLERATERRKRKELAPVSRLVREASPGREIKTKNLAPSFSPRRLKEHPRAWPWRGKEEGKRVGERASIREIGPTPEVLTSYRFGGKVPETSVSHLCPFLPMLYPLVSGSNIGVERPGQE